jgi:hypothetical protein
MVKNLMSISTLMLHPVSKEKMGPAMEVGCHDGVLFGRVDDVVEEAVSTAEKGLGGER